MDAKKWFLNEREHIIFNLYYVYGWTLKEIAEKEGVCPERIKQIRDKARGKKMIELRKYHIKPDDFIKMIDGRSHKKLL